MSCPSTSLCLCVWSVHPKNARSPFRINWGRSFFEWTDYMFIVASCWLQVIIVHLLLVLAQLVQHADPRPDLMFHISETKLNAIVQRNITRLQLTTYSDKAKSWIGDIHVYMTYNCSKCIECRNSFQICSISRIISGCMNIARTHTHWKIVYFPVRQPSGSRNHEATGWVVFGLLTVAE